MKNTTTTTSTDNNNSFMIQKNGPWNP